MAAQAQKTAYAALLRTTTCVKQGKQIHGRVVALGMHNRVAVQAKLASMYFDCGSLESSLKAFHAMTNPDVFQWNSMISRLVIAHSYKDSIALYRRMQEAGVKPDRFTLPPLLRAAAHLLDLHLGTHLHHVATDLAVHTHIQVANAIISLYGKCQQMDTARQLFDQMPTRDVVSYNIMIGAHFQHGGRANQALSLFRDMQRSAGLAPNSVTWNSVIAGLNQNEMHMEALQYFREMLLSGIAPGQVTIVSAIPACSQIGALHLGREIHRCALLFGYASNVLVENALIDLYAKCGGPDDAFRVFDMSCSRSVVSWNSLITGYALQKQFESSLKLLKQMPLAGMRPNHVTMTIVLPIIGRLALQQEGKEIHGFLLRSCLVVGGSFLELENALIDMYCKCGVIDSARTVFDRMPRRDVISWTAMVSGHGMQGDVDDALELYSEMSKSELKPDSILFVALLSACSHCGLLAEGQHYFEIMQKEFSISPRIEHYTCMVDMLGRAGKIREAEELIGSMPIKPTAAIWCALLGACRVHSNVEVGERAIQELLKLRPDHPGYYALMSNIYSEAGKWEDVAMIRKLMKDQGLRKDPGWSCIEIGNRMHEFLIGDTRHPQCDAIYALLHKITQESMLEHGYVPDTRFVLHDYGFRRYPIILK